MRRLFAPLALLPLLAACGDPLGQDCTTDVQPAVAVQIRDARTAAVLTGPATAIAREGAYADTAEIVAGDSWARLALEREGVYDITVRKAGYREWERAGVPAFDGQCHVQTVTVRADLEPAT
jgi:hypothetical protein